MAKYINTILTAFVVKKPPDYEAALSALLELRGAFYVHAQCRVQVD